MVVLIVDDQTNVVSGIFFGIAWEEIGVTRVLKAYNAYEAKGILGSQIVDIMLCDIEMPAENGIALFRWVKEKELQTECIFLTSHADFFYAKEAIQLGSFDYILQPARYEDIKRAVVRAGEAIAKKREQSRYSSYGELMYNSRDRVLQALLHNYFQEKSQAMDTLLSDFKSLDIDLRADSLFYLVLFSVSNLNLAEWDSATLHYAMNNILSELFAPYGQQVILAGLEGKCFVALIYGAQMDTGALLRQLSSMIEIMGKHFSCKLACYTDTAIRPSQLSLKMEELLEMRRNNVAMAERVFFLKQDRPLQNIHMEITWGSLWSPQSPEEALLRARSYLTDHGQDIDAEGLKRFCQSYLQLLTQLAKCFDLTLNGIFEEPERLNQFFNAHTSVEDTLSNIDYAIAFFQTLTTPGDEAKKQVEAIVQYIRANLGRDIRRRDIAGAVYLNPNYISRLFKSQMGVALKEFITEEKMTLAKMLLRTTSLPISVIAMKVGYTNFAHFSQVYKKAMGLSPTAERQQPVAE